MLQEYDKAKCIANIKELMRKKALGIGELETKAGISQGYLSRLMNANMDIKLSKALLVKVANALETSVEGIVNYQPELRKEDLRGTALKIYEFVERIVDDTLRGKYGWERLARYLFDTDTLKEKLEKRHQALLRPDYKRSTAQQGGSTFDSLFFDKYPLHSINVVEVFESDMPMGTLVLSKSEIAKEEELLVGYEMKLIREIIDSNTYVAEPVCWAIENGCSPFWVQLECLCKHLEEINTDTPFYVGVDECINSYMNYFGSQYWQAFWAFASQEREFVRAFGSELQQDGDICRLPGPNSKYTICLEPPSRITNEALIRVEFTNEPGAEADLKRLWGLRYHLQLKEDEQWDHLVDSVRKKLWLNVTKWVECPADVEDKDMFPWYIRMALALRRFLEQFGRQEPVGNEVIRPQITAENKNIEGGRKIMKTNLEAHEAMRAFVAQHEKGYIAYAKEIKDWCMNNPKFSIGSAGSIIPSDCCYNRKNDDPSSHVDLLFEFVARGKYRCLGDGYPYTGDVLHAPVEAGGKEFVVAHWENGVETAVEKEE